MKRFLCLLAVSAFCFSCTHYVQVYETKAATPIKVEEGSYVFENDTVKITYSFWAEHGMLSYTVFNKLDVPLYIDWRKSSFVSNGQKFDYWMDATTTNSQGLFGAYKSYLLPGVSGQSFSRSTTTKEDAVSFIAPKSFIIKKQFALCVNPVQDLITDNSAKDTVAPNPMTHHKMSKVKYLDYSAQTSPISFRNFLTLSTSDKFDNQIYIDNGFYICKISEMSRDVFYGSAGYGDGNGGYSMPFKSSQGFYINTGNPHTAGNH